MAKVYTIRISCERDVEVTGTSWKDAQETVRKMHESGDACAELPDPTYGVVSTRELD